MRRFVIVLLFVIAAILGLSSVATAESPPPTTQQAANGEMVPMGSYTASHDINPADPAFRSSYSHSGVFDAVDLFCLLGFILGLGLFVAFFLRVMTTPSS